MTQSHCNMTVYKTKQGHCFDTLLEAFKQSPTVYAIESQSEDSGPTQEVELSPSQIEAELSQTYKLLYTYRTIACLLKQNDIDAWIGGSLGLYLQNAIPYRYMKDVDIIVKKEDYVKACDLIMGVKDKEVKKVTKGSNPDVESYEINSVKFDLLVGNDKGVFIHNTDLMIAPVWNIVAARLSYGPQHAHYEETLKICSRLRSL